MLPDIRAQLQAHLRDTLTRHYPSLADLSAFELETPADKKHGEYASNVALKATKVLKKPPMVLAQEFAAVTQSTIALTPLAGFIVNVEAKAPGFINFYLSPKAFFGILTDIFTQKDKYGTSSVGQKAKVQIEFVSANPTGPLSVAHARQAVVGDALGNIFEAIGFDVTKEYYVNDEGRQIDLLGDSVKMRAEEILSGRSMQEHFSDDHYKGGYIKEMAAQCLKEVGIRTREELQAKRVEVRKFAVDYLMNVIQKELSDFGVNFDVWSYQSKIADEKHIQKMLEYLNGCHVLEEKDGAVWFKSTQFGDDKDRVVRKSDGSYTYLMPDIVYHDDKYKRGFQKVINFWGPDHHGYINRLKAAVQALGHDPASLIVLIVQLATIYREGQPVSMSTRSGQYIQLQEVMDEVGVDAARFFFLMRHINMHLDFDLDLAKKESPENPVYYIQYAHARINSMNQKAREAGLANQETNFQLLESPEELDLIKRLGSFSEILMICYNELDPYALATYLQELAGLFHKFYDGHRVVGEDRALSSERLALVNATKIVLANGLRLLGVSRPERM
ncbi:MAG: arginine--tRNA ligase [Candidatus Omnitrophota bacterium]|nr:arginine--tRNA ligase [Candidatus Omnitrophota bacterium]